MTTEQKAKDLFRRFVIKYNGWSTNEYTLSKPISELKKELFQKQWYVPMEMTLMCVNELQELLNKPMFQYKESMIWKAEYDYWEKVKEELKKL